MALDRQENQLELFDVAAEAAPRPHRETFGRLLIQLRYDQLVLGGMAGVIGLTIVFACGVERGKQLTRTEQLLLARAQSHDAPPSVEDAETPASTPATDEQTTTDVPAPEPAPKRATATEVAASPQPRGSSRYAVQVVTYRTAQTAKRELDRLHASGERAFLVIRGERTMVYVGPFPSKTHAVEKQTALKTLYHDCFIRTL